MSAMWRTEEGSAEAEEKGLETTAMVQTHGVHLDFTSFKRTLLTFLRPEVLKAPITAKVLVATPKTFALAIEEEAASKPVPLEPAKVTTAKESKLLPAARSSLPPLTELPHSHQVTRLAKTLPV
ncbi:Llgl Scribble Cell Polarity Complex Component 2 [Manis pentadactyla]|nr:Llgl Scribble Cell Polarity Complex Component 2 [Manis pentadactyla]